MPGSGLTRSQTTSALPVGIRENPGLAPTTAVLQIHRDESASQSDPRISCDSII